MASRADSVSSGGVGREIALLIVAAIYLCAEIAFNVQLVDAVTLPSIERENQLSWLQTAGKLLSGVGLSLVLVRLFTRAGQRAVGMRLIVCFIAGGTSMWFGQEALIKHLTDVAAPEVRRDAHLAAQLVDALTSRQARSTRMSVDLRNVTPEMSILVGFFPLIADRAKLIPEFRERLPRVLAYRYTVGCALRNDEPGTCDCESTRQHIMERKQAGTAGIPESAFLFNCVYRQGLGELENKYAVYQKAQRKLEEAGRQHASSCNGGSYLSESAECELRDEAAAAAIAKRSNGLPPNLSRSEFLAQPQVRGQFLAALRQAGLENLKTTGACAVLPRMDADQFEKCYHAPLLQKAVRTVIDRGDLPAAQFADGAPAAKWGRATYEAMIVPPLALAFSLAFSILNASLLAGSILLLLYRGVFRVFRGYSLSIPGLWVASFQMTLAVLTFWGFSRAENPLLSGPRLAELLDDVRSSASTPVEAAVAHGMVWVLRTEPSVYHIAQRVHDRAVGVAQ